MMETLWSDLRHAGRVLLNRPAFSFIAVLALALGIGANTAIFSVVNAVLIRPLPYGDPDRIVMVWEDASHVGFPRNTPAPANYVDWKRQNTVFTDLAALRGRAASLTQDGPPEMVFGRAATASLFTVLGVQPQLGRAFTADEDSRRVKVVVLSYALWQRRFGKDPGLVGRSIVMNGQNTTVIGIMPRGFSFPAKTTEFWVPSDLTAQDYAQRGSHYLNVVARLKPGVSVAQAQSEMSAIAKRLGEQYIQNRRIGAVVVPIKEQVVGDTRIALMVLLAAAASVLLIACANLANLLLAKASERKREMAVRAALGAGRRRLIRQMITESLLLSCAGGLLGVVLARWSIIALRQMIPQGMANSTSLTLDGTVLFFAVAISLLTGVGFGAVPALRLSRLDLNDVLKQGGRGGSGGHDRALRGVLVVSEVALALVLLIGAGLLIQTLMKLRSIDPGFRTEKLLTMETVLPRPKYADGAKRQAYYDAVLERVHALPGVRNAAFTSLLPFTQKGNTTSFHIEGQPHEDAQDCLLREGTRDYLATLEVHLLEGRLFGSEDRANSQGVVIVNETFKNYGWPNVSALGKRLQINATGPQAPWYTVVGVVRDVRERGLDTGMKPGVYMLVDQVPNLWGVPSVLAMRTAGDPLGLIGAARQAIWAVDREQPINDIRTMDDILDLEVANRRQQMNLLAGFAMLALVLASLGIYGVLSYLVTQRTREIGVRMALGATPRSVVRMVLREGLTLTGLGLLIGLVGALWLARLMKALVYGIGTADPATFGGTAAILAIVAMVACVIPARTAARVDPVIALREE